MTIRNNLGILTAGLFAGLSGSMASAAIIHTGGNSIDGSLCIGFDCVAVEAFGFDTLRLKENNLRLDYQDTSSAASFPANDWRVIINDSANGGANHYSIEDRSAGNQVFRVFAGARNNALVIDSQGDLGLGTSTPAVDIDIKTGNTPTVRLQQDGTAGFTPQTWDMAANETNFFIRDATNGSQLPFRIRPGADTDSLAIAADNNVGIGTISPSAQLHVLQSDKSAVMHIEDTSSTIGNLTMLQMTNVGRPRIQMTNTNPTVGQAGDWSISAGNSFVLQDRTDSQNVMIIDQDGNMTLTGSLTTTNPGGACDAGCDRVFTADYDLPTIKDHSIEMFAKGYLPNVGPTLENGPINVTEKVGRILNELEHAHIYISELETRLSKLETRLSIE